MKMSFVFIFRRRLQDVLIKKNIFTLIICLQKTSSKRLQDVIVKTNIFVLVTRRQELFKTSSRRLAKMSSRHLQDVFPRRLQDILQKRLQAPFRHFEDILKTSLRRLQYIFRTSAEMFSRCFQDVSSS